MKKIKLGFPRTTILLLGGSWYGPSYCGTRCYLSAFTPLGSSDGESSRGVCNHWSSK